MTKYNYYGVKAKSAAGGGFGAAGAAAGTFIIEMETAAFIACPVAAVAGLVVVGGITWAYNKKNPPYIECFADKKQLKIDELEIKMMEMT